MRAINWMPILSQRGQPLTGYRFLIIEDEILQAQRVGDLLTQMGGTVAKMAYGFEQAQAVIAETDFDCAILDINLSGTLSFRIAEALKLQGIPFVFCTAYAEAADVYPDSSAPRVDKPVRPIELRDAILTVLTRR
jgi:CheY-like chemotaxis protein